MGALSSPLSMGIVDGRPCMDREKKGRLEAVRGRGRGRKRQGRGRESGEEAERIRGSDREEGREGKRQGERQRGQ